MTSGGIIQHPATFMLVLRQSRHNRNENIINSTIIRSKQTQHGKDCEQTTIAKYSSYVVEVQECGLVLRKNKPYLGASQDRLIGNEIILEVKWHFNQRHQGINENTIPYIWKDNAGHLFLDHFHPY